MNNNQEGLTPLTRWDVLTACFIHLKLQGSIDWSWVMVLSPVILQLIVLIVAIIITDLKKR